MTARAIHRHQLVDVTPAYAARGIIEAMADALLVLDRDGMVRVVNPAACQLFGSSERQLLGQPIEALTSAISPTGRLGELIRSGSLRDHEVTLGTGRSEEHTSELQSRGHL